MAQTTPEECSWCGAEIDGRIYRRREEPREAYCTRAHRDAAQRAVRALRSQTIGTVGVADTSNDLTEWDQEDPYP